MLKVKPSSCHQTSQIPRSITEDMTSVSSLGQLWPGAQIPGNCKVNVLQIFTVGIVVVIVVVVVTQCVYIGIIL